MHVRVHAVACSLTDATSVIEYVLWAMVSGCYLGLRDDCLFPARILLHRVFV